VPLTLRRKIMCCTNYIEFFNRRLRYECLNVNGFLSIKEAQLQIEACRINYNRY
jgi:hypothetical protein